jgi:hypothetical protein
MPTIHRLLESGRFKAGEYSVEGEGRDGNLKAWAAQNSEKLGSKKIIATVVTSI